MSDFEILHIARLTSMELFTADVVEPEAADAGKKNPSDRLRVEMFFLGTCNQKGDDKVISGAEIKLVHSTLGNKMLAKFKLDEDVFQRLLQMGLLPGTTSDWDVIPQPWSMPGKTGPKLGIWYQPVSLIKLNGKVINYQILKSSTTKKPRQNAFERFGGSNNTHTNWDASLGNLERQINTELEGAAT